MNIFDELHDKMGFIVAMIADILNIVGGSEANKIIHLVNTVGVVAEAAKAAQAVIAEHKTN